MGARYDDTDRPSLRVDLQSLSPRVVLITGLVVVRLADVTVTWVGLQRGLVETNPVAVAIMNAVGVVPGLVGASLGVVLMLVLVVEASVAYLRANPQVTSERWVCLLRRTSYTFMILLWSGVVLYNTILIIAQGT